MHLLKSRVVILLHQIQILLSLALHHRISALVNRWHVTLVEKDAQIASFTVWLLTNGKFGGAPDRRYRQALYVPTRSTVYLQPFG